MVNYLMTLGWAPTGDTEIVPWSEIEDEFRLEDVTHSPAFFDLKKLAAFNGEYIRALPRRGVRRRRASRGSPSRLRPRRVRGDRAAVQTRVVTLAEAPPMVDFLFVDDPPIDEASWAEGDGASRGRGRCSTRRSPRTRRRRGTPTR